MPTLNWIGKEAVVKHHKEAPFRLLEPLAELSCETPLSPPLSGGMPFSSPDKGRPGGVRGETGNLIVQGDNLLIGGLWAELSGGRCRFVMVKDKKWEGIEALLVGGVA